MKRTLQVLLLTATCLLGFTARLWNARDIFLEGRIYFVDPDCYSRMTRARHVADGHGWIIRQHDFENWPAGTRPHTTAPMDWLIVAGQRVLDVGFHLLDRRSSSVLRSQTLDLSGALIGPLLGAMTCGILAFAGLRLGWRGWAAPAIFCAVSPVLVHGTVLGRPDHQALLIPLLALALAAELAVAKSWSRGWGIAAGFAWSGALWTSLYEPLILFSVVSVFLLVANRRRFTAPALRPGWVVFIIICATALLVDGWRVSWPDPAMRESFVRWQQTIGELAHLDPRAPLLFRWLGAGILVVPLALAWSLIRARRRGEPLAPAALVTVLLLVSFGLTVWQLRWGYFLGLAFAVSLPVLFELPGSWRSRPLESVTSRGRSFLLRAAPVAGAILFLASLWPLAADWDEKLFPEDHAELDLDKQLGVVRIERVRLREVAEAMRSTDRRPFLAPWWLSPALAYWSGQPGVAGSSHESLPGIVTSARLFVADDAPSAEKIAREAGVKWIVTDDGDRMMETSRVLLGQPATKTVSFLARLHEIAEPRERVRAADLRAASPEAQAALVTLADQAEAAHLGTAAFSCVSTNQFYKLFSVKPASP